MAGLFNIPRTNPLPENGVGYYGSNVFGQLSPEEIAWQSQFNNPYSAYSPVDPNAPAPAVIPPQTAQADAALGSSTPQNVFGDSGGGYHPSQSAGQYTGNFGADLNANLSTLTGGLSQTASDALGGLEGGNLADFGGLGLGGLLGDTPRERAAYDLTNAEDRWGHTLGNYATPVSAAVSSLGGGLLGAGAGLSERGYYSDRLEKAGLPGLTWGESLMAAFSPKTQGGIFADRLFEAKLNELTRKGREDKIAMANQVRAEKEAAALAAQQAAEAAALARGDRSRNWGSNSSGGWGSDSNATGGGGRGSSGNTGGTTGDGGGYTCFHEDARVTMADGSLKRIAEVVVGDNVQDTQGGVNTVIDIDTPDLGLRELYSINGGEDFVTWDHPFLRDDGGWVSISPENSHRKDTDFFAGALEVGTIIQTDNGNVEVTSLEPTDYDDEMKLYDLHLDGNHQYYVNGFIVHNC